MGAALSELAQIQNNILNQLVEIYSSEKGIEKELLFDMDPIPVQKLKPDHILGIKLDDFV